MTYSSMVAHQRRQYATKQHNMVKATDAAEKLGPISNTIILIVLASIVGLMYLAQVTRSNALGYEINTLDQKYEQLVDQKGELEVNSARLQSYQRIQSARVASNLPDTQPSITIR